MSTTATVDRVQKFLTWCGCTDLEPLELRIEGRSFTACRYKQTLIHSEGTPAYRRGERTYTVDAIYIVGRRPLDRDGHRNKVCYRLPDDERDWYVAGYILEPIPVQYREYHPLGEHFTLQPWDVPDGSKIDTSLRPYTRVRILYATEGGS